MAPKRTMMIKVGTMMIKDGGQENGYDGRKILIMTL